MNSFIHFGLALVSASSAASMPHSQLLNKTFEVCISADANTAITKRLTVDAATGKISDAATNISIDYLFDPYPDRRRFSKIARTGIVGKIGAVKRLYYTDGRQAFLVEKKFDQGRSVFVFFRFAPNNGPQEKAALMLARTAFSCSAADIQKRSSSIAK